jgi:hypothetical protein
MVGMTGPRTIDLTGEAAADARALRDAFGCPWLKPISSPPPAPPAAARAAACRLAPRGPGRRQVLNALVDRTGVDPALVEDVIMGCVMPGRRAGDQRRRATRCWPASCPKACPRTSVDRQCGSSQQALHFAAQAVMSGSDGLRDRRRRREHDARADGHPDLPRKNGFGNYMSPEIEARYPGIQFSQFMAPR